MKFGGGTVYKRILMVNNKLKWKFEGVLHEYIVCIDKDLNNNVGMIEGNYFVDSGKTGARSRDPNKYYNDALLLEKAYEKENGSSIGVRYAFYCAQSYRDAGMKEKSIEWYKKRVDLKGWNQEVYFSYLMIGRQYMDINEPEKAIYYWSLSIEADKERLECLYEIISYYRRINKYDIAFGYFKMIFKNNDFYNMDWLKVDLNEKLFSSRDVYLFLLIYEMTIILYYVHEFKLGIHFYKYLFKNSKEYNCYNIEIAISLYRNYFLLKNI
jgi:tetratricopeptide (TPR) repeat protein